MLHQLKQRADKLGLPFGERHKTFNSRLAQELGLWAEDRGYGHAFHITAFKAYFADGKNLALLPVLITLAESCGLPPAEAEEVLVKRSYKAAVDRDWDDSRRLQITAVPTFIMNNSRLVGAQGYTTLQGLMLQHGVDKLK
jgi:predicted DsbA family dithiol-disulfide isomerase